MVILESQYSRIHRGYRITSVSYGGKPPEPELPPVETGEFLPNGKPFPMNTEPPLASFKTYIAMCEAGLKSKADHILRNNHRSWITTDYIKKGMLNFAGKPPIRTTDPVYYELLDDLRKQLNTEDKLFPLSLKNAGMKVPQSTSPGLPFIITHKGMKKGDVLREFYPKFEKYWNRVGDNLGVIPLDDTAAFARSHISSTDVNKVRAVWCTPLNVIIQEARFALPITNGLIKQDYGHNTCYGMEMMKGGMTWLNSQLEKARCKDPGLTCVMTDYSSFDSTVPAWLIRDVFSVFLEKFDLTHEIDENGNKIPTDEKKELRKFKKLINYFINTPIRLNNGERFLKDHGVPSGSVFTNLMDTAVNFIVSRYIQRKVYGKNALFDLYFGDDGLMVMPEGSIIDIKKTSEVAKDVFGLNLSEKKSYHTSNMRNVKMLGYFNNRGSPLKPSSELFLSMLYPQRLRDDWAYCLSRALGCLLASGGGNPDVFLAAQAVFRRAADKQEVERGLQLIKSNPRARRHLEQMGCGDYVLTHHFFFDISMSIPRDNCTKIQKGIYLV